MRRILYVTGFAGQTLADQPTCPAMHILYLGPDHPLIDWLRAQGDTVIATSAALEPEFCERNPADFLLSFGYGHIVRREVLQYFAERAVNLHPSILPWNRGQDPNFWSFVDQTPKGVTLHFMDEGVDTGDIIAQQSMPVLAGDTLRTTYDRLQQMMPALLQQHWPQIRRGCCPRRPQAGRATFHRRADKNELFARLPAGWDTPVVDLPQLLAGVG